MPKPLSLLAAIALFAGCVSVAPQTQPPATSGPSFGITTMAPSSLPSISPSPLVTPTLAPTDAPTLGPTLEPTDTPAAVSPEPTPGLSFDDRDLLFHDTFSDPASGWGVGDVTGTDGSRVGSIAYLDGTLAFDVDSSGAWLWTRRETGAVNGTVRMAGQFEPSSEGGFGLLCGSGQDVIYGAVVFTNGAWILARIAEGAVEELASDAGAGLDIPVGESTLLAIECAGTATGRLRMQLWLEGTGPVAMYESDEGPANFDRAAIYAEASSEPYSVALNEMIVFGVTGADGQMNAAGQGLLTHVPDAWQSTCYQSPVPPIYGGFASANLACFIGTPGDDGAEIAEYAAYPSKEAMDAAYQDRVDNFGIGSTASCSEGPGERGYNIGGDETGRVLCADQTVGIRFDWSDDRLNILASLVDFDADYETTFADWASGGPNP